MTVTLSRPVLSMTGGSPRCGDLAEQSGAPLMLKQPIGRRSSRRRRLASSSSPAPYIDEPNKSQPWRHALLLKNWLNTKPWRDPVLPLTTAPRAIASEAPAAEPPPQPSARRELSDAEIVALGDSWAQQHGFASIASMQRDRSFSGVSVALGDGKFHRFEPIRETA